MVLNSVVNETLSLDQSLELTLANTWTYANGGGCGLIVHNNGNNVVAYDRCSPIKNSGASKVVVDGMQVVDSNTGAKWLLMDGSPIHIAECSLQRYQVRKSGNLYVITN
ncbi:hypothetical protein [Sphingobacterium bovistauri]|nr:hypothetical protein [Sphingobacterium bovistauri]